MGPDGREGIPGLPGSKVQVIIKGNVSVPSYSSDNSDGYVYRFQGIPGRNGAPGDAGLQGLPVCRIYNPLHHRIC